MHNVRVSINVDITEKMNILFIGGDNRSPMIILLLGISWPRS